MDEEHIVGLEHSIVTPTQEEEEAFVSRPTQEKLHGKGIRDIDPKDNRAFWLTCGCVLLLALFCVADVIATGDIIEESQMLESFVDILKYIITTSLGFFFATTVTKKD